MNGNAGNRAEAERLLGIAEKLLQNRDYNGTKEFAVLAQETEPLLEGSDQILAVADVLLNEWKRVDNQRDWCSILQVVPHSTDQELIKKQYRRLALLLHPDKNKFPFADHAFKLVADAWAVLSDNTKNSSRDNFSKVDLSNPSKLPGKKSEMNKFKGEAYKWHNDYDRYVGQNQRRKLSSFWTVCPYCYLLYEYPMVYENCCLLCQNCHRAYHAILVPSLPPLVPGKDAYYCRWGLFPMVFVLHNVEGENKSRETNKGRYPSWTPQMFGKARKVGDANDSEAMLQPNVKMVIGVRQEDTIDENNVGETDWIAPTIVKRKRGRPRKNSL